MTVSGAPIPAERFHVDKSGLIANIEQVRPFRFSYSATYCFISPTGLKVLKFLFYQSNPWNYRFHLL